MLAFCWAAKQAGKRAERLAQAASSIEPFAEICVLENQCIRRRERHRLIELLVWFFGRSGEI
jgi:hypothetical protein